MNWDSIDEQPPVRRINEAQPPVSYYDCIKISSFAAAFGLLLFNAIAIANIQSDAKQRIAASEAAMNARMAELETQLAQLRGASFGHAVRGIPVASPPSPLPPPPLVRPPPPPLPPPKQSWWQKDSPRPPPPPQPLPPFLASPPPPLVQAQPQPQQLLTAQSQQTQAEALEDLHDDLVDRIVAERSSDELLAYVAIGLLLLAACLCICFCAAGALYVATTMRDDQAAREKLNKSPSSSNPYAA